MGQPPFSRQMLEGSSSQLVQLAAEIAISRHEQWLEAQSAASRAFRTAKLAWKPPVPPSGSSEPFTDAQCSSAIMEVLTPAMALRPGVRLP
jgi:hypothetical protein